MRKSILLAGVLIYGLMLAGTQVSYAEGGDNTNEPADAQALLAAKVTAAQAIQTAETKAGGKVSSISFESDSGSASFYHVEVVTPDGAQKDLAVDATTGEVMKYVAMEDDEKRGGDNSDENGADDGDQD